jgi:two-component system sensor histidine kinase TctE
MALSAPTHKPSLRSRLVRHVMAPLVITWAIGTALTVGIANYFVAQAYDRSLLDDAYSVVAHVRTESGRPTLNLSQTEMATLLFDQSEQVYFALLSPGGDFLAGHAGLRTPMPERLDAAVVFGKLSYQGRSLRTVMVLRKEPVAFRVVMAQTTASRERLLAQLLAYSLVPQALLLLLLAWWLRRAIQSDLAPLAALQVAVRQRDARDLTPLAVTASTRDVQHLGDAVNDLLARLQEVVRAQREFAGNVAHELRTPLAGIRALAGYGLAQTDPLRWRAQLQDIARSEERASHMVDQLLALALADEAHAAMPLGDVALHELARDAVMRFMPRADALGVDLGAQGLDAALLVRGHAALIEGILNNLLDNALRYGRASEGVVSEVTVRVQRLPDGAIELAVLDNGPGMNTEQANGLLARWAQGHAGQQLGQGAGLGLAIVVQYARLMGAVLTLHNAGGAVGQVVSLRFAASVHHSGH